MTLSVNWSGKAKLIRVFYYGDHDPVLVIRQPGGKYVCIEMEPQIVLRGQCTTNSVTTMVLEQCKQPQSATCSKTGAGWFAN